jgi:phosphatidylserine/phosphatidylglycerophosphate/cardiolipin synthase-like enzyme
VDVKLIADLEQTQKIRHNSIADIAAAGVPVWLDAEHGAAHNKVMVIDADSVNIADVTVITGSYNFTNAAQYRNAENVLLIHADRSLAKAYQNNWQRHLPHSRPLTADKFEH